MSQIYAIKSLSVWSDTKLCCFVVLILSTYQFVCTESNTTEPRCSCNFTATGSSLNATGKLCKCLQGSRNCTNGYKLVNSTCIQCLCNATDCNYAGNYSSSGQLLNCYKPCPAGFKRTMGNKCVTDKFTNVLVRDKQLSTDSMVAISESSVTMLNTVTSTIPSPTKKMRLPSSTIALSTEKLLSTKKLPSTSTPLSRKSTQHTIILPSASLWNSPSPTFISFYVKTASSTIQSQTLTFSNSPSHNMSSSIPSNTTEMPSSTFTSTPTDISTTSMISLSSSIMSANINSPSYNSKIPPHTVQTKPATNISPSIDIISPSSTESPSALPTMLPPPTDKHMKKSTTKKVLTTDHECTTKPSSELPTTKGSTTTKKMPDEKDRSSDVVVIVLVCLGVVVVLGIAVAVGCWYLRAKRKQSAPIWTVELSDPRHEDFALLDTVTAESQTPNKTTEAENSITEHSRYYAYI